MITGLVTVEALTWGVRPVPGQTLPSVPSVPTLPLASTQPTAAQLVTTTRSVSPTTAPRSIGQASSGVTTSTTPLINRRGVLQRNYALGQGQLRFEAPVSERPRMSAGSAVAIATRSVQAKVSGTRHEAFFALFSATSPAQPNPDGTSTPVFDRRPVWVVRFPTVRGRRQSGVVQRKNSPTTTSLDVLTEIVAIIDDRSGKFLLSSEYLAESAPRRGE